MARSGRAPGIGVLVFSLCAPSCSFLMMTAPPLFSPSETVDKIDFEKEQLGRLPDAFEARSGSWSVIDSPNAASGYQVLVEHGDAPSDLGLKGTAGSRRVGGEVALRVLVGASGAGIACEGPAGESYVIKLEPEAGRAVLYRRTGESMAPVASTPAERTKGAWFRLGILCRPDLVVGYLDGEPALRRRVSLRTPITLALYSDGGIVAQFDDLKFATRK